MISLIYGTINSIPFLVIVKLFFIWVCVSVPLTVVGTMIGRHGTGGTGRNKTTPLDQFPCRVNAIPRPIPEDVPWYGKPSGLITLAGLLCCDSIFIELYYVQTSLWNYRFYHVYGFLLCVYTIVVSMTSVIVVYFCLNAENYLWQWIAFGSGASKAAYVFLYGIYYFPFKTKMHGLLQTLYYFGYMSLIALNLGILCGTIGHGAASRFVRAIFENVKVGLRGNTQIKGNCNNNNNKKAGVRRLISIGTQTHNYIYITMSLWNWRSRHSHQRGALCVYSRVICCSL